jgi:hypothetical protein
MAQPKWKYVDNLGDEHPLEHGGYFIFEDTTGVYPPEAEIYDPEDGKAYRFMLDPLVFVHVEFGGEKSDRLLVRHIWDMFNSRDERPRYSMLSYNEWFTETALLLDEQQVLGDTSVISLLTSDNILERAMGYREIGEYWGYDNLDGYPLQLTEEEAEERYANLGALADMMTGE